MNKFFFPFSKRTDKQPHHNLPPVLLRNHSNSHSSEPCCCLLCTASSTWCLTFLTRLHLQPCPHSWFQKKGLWILYLWVSKRQERPGASTKPEIHNGSSLSVPVCMWIDRHHSQSSFSYLCSFGEVSLNTRERILDTLLIHSSWYRFVLSRWVQNTKNI